MPDEEENTNSNIKETLTTQAPATPGGPIVPPPTGPLVNPQFRNIAESVDINQPMTISAETVHKATDLLAEEKENWGEPANDRTHALSQVMDMLVEATKIVESTGKMQVIAITTTARIQQMTKLQQIKVDTEAASRRLAVQAAIDKKTK